MGEEMDGTRRRRPRESANTTMAAPSNRMPTPPADAPAIMPTSTSVKDEVPPSSSKVGANGGGVGGTGVGGSGVGGGVGKGVGSGNGGAVVVAGVGAGVGTGDGGTVVVLPPTVKPTRRAGLSSSSAPQLPPDVPHC